MIGELIMDNWINKSRQNWKLVIASVMCLISIILFAVFFIIKPLNNTIYLSLLFIAIGSAFCMLFCFIWIKCPYCKRSVAYYLIRHSSMQDWLMKFINIESCPMCNSKF